ncbi:Uncharacterized protein Rs2_38805 [Raphanus sativus]|nr:Uncharacterized protein Rs2_38805 [Raphanus sativus]
MKSQRVEIKVICKDPSTLESKEDKILLLVDKDRYRIHGFYNKSVLLIFQTPAASPPFPYFSVTVVVSIFWVQDVSMLLLKAVCLRASSLSFTQIRVTLPCHLNFPQKQSYNNEGRSLKFKHSEGKLSIVNTLYVRDAFGNQGHGYIKGSVKKTKYSFRKSWCRAASLEGRNPIIVITGTARKGTDLISHVMTLHDWKPDSIKKSD